MAKDKSKEEQQRRVMPLSAFDLKKAKITKDGVDVTHHETGTDAGEITKSGEVQPHPDLQTALDGLKLYMATRLGLLAGWDYCRENLRDNPEALAGAVQGHKDVVELCKVNGVAFMGEGDTYGVKISGYLKTGNGDGTGLSVPKILFSGEKLGYEAEVSEICDNIKSEVYKYRFQSKKLQLDIETEAQKAEQAGMFDGEDNED